MDIRFLWSLQRYGYATSRSWNEFRRGQSAFLYVGNDLTQLSDETLEIITNKEIIALNQTNYVYQARRMVDYGDLEVWGKPLIDSMSGEVAVALLNRSNEPQPINFALEQVGIDASAGFIVKDLWSKKEFNTTTEPNFVHVVPAHGVVVLKIKGKSIPYNVFQYKDKTDKK